MSTGVVRQPAGDTGKTPVLDFCDYGEDSPFRRVWTLLDTILERVEAEDQRVPIAQTYRLICSESLRRPPDARAGRVSVISGAGLPFEFSFTTADPLGTVRFLSEAAPASMPLPDRVARGLDCLTELVVFNQWPGATRLNELMHLMLPTNLADFDASWPNGALWISARFAHGLSPVLRVYVNQQWNNNAFRFVNAHKVFTFLGEERNAARLVGLFNLVDDWAPIAGLSFDLSAAGLGGIKLYLGATQASLERLAALLERLGLRRFHGQAVTFLRNMKLVEKRFEGPSLLVSVGFPSDEGEPLSAKLDVTTRAVFEDDRDAYEATETLFHAFRVHCLGYRACEELFFPRGFPPPGTHTLQYVGLALPGRGRPRLNVYLAPPADA